jgi:hypothetical protein
MNGLLLSACQENETASASTPKTDGKSAFTFALLQAVAAQGTGVSSRRLNEEVKTSLAQLGFRQTPVLMEPAAPAGIADRSFLSLADTGGAKTGFDVPMSPEMTRIVRQIIETMRTGASPSPAAPRQSVS